MPVHICSVWKFQNEVLHLLCLFLLVKLLFDVTRSDLVDTMTLAESYSWCSVSRTDRLVIQPLLKSLMSQKEIPHGSQGRDPVEVCVVWQEAANKNPESERDRRSVRK